MEQKTQAFRHVLEIRCLAPDQQKGQHVFNQELKALHRAAVLQQRRGDIHAVAPLAVVGKHLGVNALGRDGDHRVRRLGLIVQHHQQVLRLVACAVHLKPVQARHRLHHEIDGL